MLLYITTEFDVYYSAHAHLWTDCLEKHGPVQGVVIYYPSDEGSPLPWEPDGTQGWLSDETSWQQVA